MVITGEYKFPPRIRLDTGEDLIRLSRAAGINPTLAVNHHQNRQTLTRARKGPGKEGGSSAIKDFARRLSQYLEDFNTHLAEHQVPVHLTLVQHGDSFSLEIYDLSGSDVCRLVGGRDLDLGRLPEFLRSLQEEVGVLVDNRV